ncbi:16S rRNA (cytosine(1402)-N(4))-methyltransferase RsmH [Saprospiraceae bacterium]|jgi:16S rRNA (cytosine1402-N4)-methyltransferase|nr:16S rRNA (cytosine(1402)-N(4))-methyltransferase RsmH [Bacteroidota bacterium]MDB4728028.1 16S rRNA (cytosine(1402)-N(4))-methyltransferase RsmH [Saprospiraceae bacterium]MDF1865128.1 16S rRNA (cytosine(1402)-N(4))-methyltransferase RsmH [Saprospiraceae bacterium]
MSYHDPALAKECIEGLSIQPNGIYVDATFGGGGHSKLILDELGEDGQLQAFDQDEDALRNLLDDSRFVFNHHNFRFMKRFLKLHGVRKVDGILADLGVSSHQLDEAKRGFSFRFEAELDMRMNQEDSKKASDIVNTYNVIDLQKVFSAYGEVRNSKSLAERIVQERSARKIITIADFLNVIDPLIRGQRNRYLAQVFQALRIEVNDEMGALKTFLEESLEVLKENGRLVIISYHSIEDRVVKNFLKTGNVEGALEKDDFGNIYRPFKLINKKPILPSADEIRQNPRARSAKLRVGSKQ